MTEFDARLAEQLERLVPPAEGPDDWQAIVRAAGNRRRRRRLVQLGTVLALLAVVVSPVGAAVVHGIADFSAWLRGQPGSPAAEADQQAFERSNSRSWGDFPEGTKLRSLIKREIDGHSYELFGFRSGDSFCLRLVGRGLSGSPALSCAPRVALERAKAPVVVVLADHGLVLRNDPIPGDSYRATEAQASFGLVADGVRAVELSADDGSHEATIASNAFLYVASKPKLGTRIRAVEAVTGDGSRLAVPFQSAPFGTWDLPAPAHDRPTGPSSVQRHVEGGMIGWLLRQEERGEAPPEDAPYMRGPMAKGLEFARLLTPDPASHMRVLVAIGTLPHSVRPTERALCFFLVSGGGAGGGCNALDDPFPRGPITVSQTIREGGDQYATLHGLASDDVARVQLFLANGETQPVALRDNAWIAQVARADHPVRVVAYDRDDRIIGVETMPGESVPGMPRPRGQWRTILAANDDRGGKGIVRVAPSTDGGRCFEIRLPGGGGQSGCPPMSNQTPPLSVGISIGVGGAWIGGQVGDEVATVELVFRNGQVEHLRPIDGFILRSLGAGTTVERNELEAVVGRDREGREISTFRPLQAPGG